MGNLKKNTHSGSAMICNSLAIQHGKAANEKNLKINYLTKGKKPAPLFTPADGKGQYWLTGGGIMTKNGLYLVAGQIVKTDDNSVFGFKSIGNTILAVNDPLDEPDRWRVDEIKIPFFLNSDETEIDFASPQFIKDGRIYIYGVEFNKKENDRYLLLARVAEEHFLNFGKWEFYSNGQWGNDYTKADRLCYHY